MYCILLVAEERFGWVCLGVKKRRNAECSPGQREAEGSAERQSNHCYGRMCLSLISLLL